jgi:hypothetical protein
LVSIYPAILSSRYDRPRGALATCSTSSDTTHHPPSSRYLSSSSNNPEPRPKWYALPARRPPSDSAQGKRKKATKPPPKKKGASLPVIFSCLFCNHENSVTVKIDKKAGVGALSCQICGQTFQTPVNCAPPGQCKRD